MRKHGLFAMTAAILVMSGCASFSNYQTAQYLGAGNSQFGIGLTATNQSVDGPEVYYENVVYFTPEFMFRTGITETFDAGAKLYLSFPFVGAVINGKYQFLDGPSLDMALDIGVGYTGVEINDNDIILQRTF